MSFELGITTFKVGETIVVENLSKPGFDYFELFSITPTDTILLTKNIDSGVTFDFSYSSEGTRLIKLVGTKNLPAGGSYISEKGITVSVGYSPDDYLYYAKREDQSKKYFDNYIQRGVTFVVNRLEITAGTEPKTYNWTFSDEIPSSSDKEPIQIFQFNNIGFKSISLTTENNFGRSDSNLSFIAIDTPVLQIIRNPEFGTIRTGTTLSLDFNFESSNQHGINDIEYNWIINGIPNSNKQVSLNYSTPTVVGITLQYFSKILTGLSGNTFGFYNIEEVPGIYSIYVSGNTGNDVWSGEYPGISGTQGPVKTFEKAAQLAKSYTGSLDIDINIAGGTYQYTEQSFYLTGPDSGINRRITYKPLSGQKVIISGGYTLSPALFTLVTAGNTLIYNRLKVSARGNVYGADLSSYGISFGTTLPEYWNGRAVQNKYLPSIPELFYNGNKMNVSRWPNRNGSTGDTQNSFDYNTSAYIDSVVQSGSYATGVPGSTNGIFKYSSGNDSVITRWKVTGPSSFDGIWIHGYWKWDWHDEVYKVKSINTTTREIEVFSSNGVYGIAKNNPCISAGPFVYANPTNRRWFAFNLLDEIDTQGEYYLDRGGKKLYFWPPSSIGSTSSIVLSSIRLAGDNSWIPGTPVINDSQLQQQSNLNTNNVNASLFKFFKLKNVTIEGLEFYYMSGSGIEMTLCENVIIKNCKIYSPRKNGIVVVGGKNNKIYGCEIYYPGLKGVILTGGDRQNLIPAKNSLENSKIIGSGRLTTSSGTSILLTGVGNTVTKNIIANSGSFGMKLHGNDHIVEFNNFTNLISEMDDSGGIYIANNISDRDSIIRYNFFNNVKTQLPGGSAYTSSLPIGGCPNPPVKTMMTSAIYIDEFNCGVKIQSNVFYNCGSTLSDAGGAVFITHGLDHIIENNIIIDSKTGIGHWYSTKQLWNSNSKGLTSGNQNIAVQGLQQIINVDNDPWYEDGAPEFLRNSTVPFTARNYTPYSFFASGYGVEGTYRSTKGLLNKVNVTGIIWTTKYPQLASGSGMINYDAGNKLMTFNPSYPLKNIVRNNAFINVNRKTRITGTTTESYFEEGDAYEGVSYDIFEDKNNLNFKLTTFGLRTIIEQVPGFQDIPFEEIPVI